MRKKSLFATILIIILIAVPLTGFTHSGRTDSSGGHKDNKNKSGLGSYHYHCGGHSPHLHDGGVCPYDSSSSTKATKTPAPTPTPRPAPKAVISKEVDDDVLQALEFPAELPFKRGDKGDGVKEIQEKLVGLGYLSVADGIFGKITESAVKNFEADYAFEIDGIIEEDEYFALTYWVYES